MKLPSENTKMWKIFHWMDHEKYTYIFRVETRRQILPCATPARNLRHKTLFLLCPRPGMQSVCWFGSYKHSVVSRWIYKYRVHEKWLTVLLFLSYHLYAIDYKTAQTLTESLDPDCKFLENFHFNVNFRNNPNFPQIEFFLLKSKI